MARESPTLATNKCLPIKTAVEAVEPSSLEVLHSASKKSESVFLYVSPAICHHKATKLDMFTWGEKLPKEVIKA